MPILNSDGKSVKNCSYIYAPRGQAGEYAELATNPYRGCGHKCAYCYVPKIFARNGMTRAEFDAGAVPRKNYIPGLIRDAKKYQALGANGQVMLCFTTDPYPPEHHLTTRTALEVLAEYGLSFCTLTKGGSRALRDIDLFRPGRDSFATTLTSLDTKFSLKWERAAAIPSDRISTLKEFHRRGIFTWVSLEPTLDVDSSIEIIKATHDFVDLYKVGRVNYSGLTKTIDWENYTMRIVDLMGKLNQRHYIKKDLQKYLPDGYYNPLRIDQHN